MQGFADFLRQDLDAVTACLTLSWCTPALDTTAQARALRLVQD
ncbi:hypothetical protein ACFU5O_35250 [Streptomyces sp. NPDC057445]